MPQADPVAQAKALKFLAKNMLFAGLIVGVGVPVLFVVLGVQVEMTSWGVDVVWLVLWAIMIFDFILARVFWRRAKALEQGDLR